MIQVQAETRAEAVIKIKAMGLSKTELTKIVSDLGYKTKPATIAKAIQMIADRLLAAKIAYDRSQI